MIPAFLAITPGSGKTNQTFLRSHGAEVSALASGAAVTAERVPALLRADLELEPEKLPEGALTGETPTAAAGARWATAVLSRCKRRCHAAHSRHTGRARFPPLQTARFNPISALTSRAGVSSGVALRLRVCTHVGADARQNS